VTRLLDRLLRTRDGYWEGLASGAAVFTTSYGAPDREALLPQFTEWAKKAYSNNGVVFAAVLTRMLILSEAEFQWQALDDRHLFGTTDLAILEEPWGPGSTSGELVIRMEQDQIAGNAYIWRPPGEDLLVRLRPDWTTIVSEVVNVTGGGQYRRKVGYFVQDPVKAAAGQDDGQFYPAGEVAHWAPIPDPVAEFRGMSWMTPVVRNISSDDGMTQYQIKYLENAASPNLLIRYANKLQPGTIDSIRERMNARYGGVTNAFKTLVLDQGADTTIIGNNLSEMDFSNVSAGGAERILAAAGVPGVLVGIEPLRGAGRGYQESMQKFANLWARPTWRSLCSCLETICPPPATGSRLWVDTANIAALQDGELERGQSALVNAQALLTLSQAGYDRMSAVEAVQAADWSLLKESALPPAPAGGPVQHMMPQQQPGVTATPLPPSDKALPVGSTSPGDGGNGTRPAPQPSAGRRSADVLRDDAVRQAALPRDERKALPPGVNGRG
jgi:hypothetical protein